MRHFQFWPRKLSHTLTLPQVSVWRNLEVSALRFPDKPCLVFYGGTTTYARCKLETERLAGYLQRQCGIQRGDRVALFIQNSPQFVIGYYAVLRADAVVVPINAMNQTEELSKVLRDSGARVVILGQELYAQAAPLLGTDIDHAIVACYSDYVGDSSPIPVPEAIAAPRSSIQHPKATLWFDAMSREMVPSAHVSTPNDVCVLPYTSGSTGIPKGCVHSHRGVMHTAATGAHWADTSQDDRVLGVLPFFHVTGMQKSMNMAIYAGASLVILPRWNSSAAMALIQHYRITMMTCVPTMIVDLVSNPAIGEHDISSLRNIGGGGAAMPEGVARKLNALCGLTFVEGYGLTETLAPTHINPQDRPKPQCLGIPVFNVDARIVEPNEQRELPQGEVGEIVVHGPQVLDHYWNRPAEDAVSFLTLDGKRFLRTGDLGRIDEDGYFHYVDRLKRMINCAGFKVWPAEIESLLYSHPAVQEAVVISRSDPRKGESVKAVIVARPDARGTVTAEEILAWARERLAAYKVPREIEFVDSLPRLATGKIDWRSIQARESERGASTES